MVNVQKQKKWNIPAALWKRVIAYFIDVLLINIIIVYPFRNLLSIDENASFTEIYNHLLASPSAVYNLFLVSLSIMALMVLYWGIFEYRFSQSIGKMLMRISVISVNGNKLGFWQAMFRNLSKISSLLLGIEVIYMLYKKSSQRYLELVSGTEVIEGSAK